MKDVLISVKVRMTSKHIISHHLSFFIRGNTILRLYYSPSEDNVKIILFFHTTLCRNRHESFALKSNGVQGCATERFISHISELWPPDVLQGFPSNLPSILIFEHLNPFLRFWKSPPVWPSLRGHAHHRPPPPSWPGLWGSIISLTPAGRSRPSAFIFIHAE